MADWTDLSSAFGFSTQLTAAQMQQLRDNVQAVAEGSSGAPTLRHVALPSFCGSLEMTAAGLYVGSYHLVARHCVYIPANPGHLHAYATATPAEHLAVNIRFGIAGNYSTGANMSSGTWVNIGSLDASAYAGTWQNLDIFMQSSGVGVSSFSVIHGYSFAMI